MTVMIRGFKNTGCLDSNPSEKPKVFILKQSTVCLKSNVSQISLLNRLRRMASQ